MHTLFKSKLNRIKSIQSLKLASLSAFVIAALSYQTKIANTTGAVPNQNFPSSEVGKMIGPQMSSLHLNQPIVFDGYAILTGNGVHEVWNISDPYRPSLIKKITSAHASGEAESHEVPLHRDGNGNYYMATISGKGFDIWNVTDIRNPVYVKAVLIPNINYGDVDNGVWGLSWQGKYIYVGATNQGVYVVDVSNMQSPKVKAQVPMTQLGGVKSGPLFALGNLLVVTSPKDNTGVATIDITDPEKPIVLDYVKPKDNASYFGGFYGKNAVVINPVRFYDVMTDPSNIKLVGQKETVKAEYLSFDEGKLFLGGVRGGSQGIHIFDLSNLANIQQTLRIPGRDSRWDDQFSCPVGNMVIIADDQKVNNQYVGAKLAVHGASKNTKGPTVLSSNPKANATEVSVNSSIAISFSDWIEFKSVSKSSFIVRPATGGDPIPGTWSWLYTTLTFTPDYPLALDAKYEVVLNNGITDLVGNPIQTTYRFTFTTGTNSTVVYNNPEVNGNIPTSKGGNIQWTVKNPSTNVIYEWTKEGEILGTGAQSNPSFAETGRYQGCVRVYEKRKVVGLKTYEAESGFFSSGSGSFGSSNAGYTGAGYMDFSSSTGNNVYLEWQVDSPSDALANLSIRYANGGATNRPLSLIVNGKNITTFNFAATGGWSNYSTTPSFNGISLKKGINSIRLVANAGSEGANIDNLQIDIKNNIAHVREAEAGQRNGGVVTSTGHSGYTGSGFVDFPDKQGAGVNVTWNITNSAKTTSKLMFRYANGGTANRPLNVRVNGGSPMLVNFPSTGSWTNWQTVTTGNVPINSGANTIVLSADAGAFGANIDQITVATQDDVMGRLLESNCFIQVIFEKTSVQPKSSASMAKLGDAIWNVNSDAGTISSINISSYKKLQEVTVGSSPKSIATVGNNLWVVNKDSWNISVVSAATGSVINTYELPYASQPNSIIVSHDEQFAYVGLQALGKVLKISTSTGSTVGTAVMGGVGDYETIPQLGAMALNASGQKLLVCRLISKDNAHGEVYEVNPSTMSVIKTVKMLSSKTADAPNNSRGIPNYLTGITINPNGKEAWVASKKDNIERGLFRDGNFLEQETTVRAITSRIDLGTMSDLLDKRIDIDNSERCNSVTFNDYGDIAFITLPGNNEVAVLDSKTGDRLSQFKVGKVPDASIFDPASKKLFVHNFMSRSISVIDVASLLNGSGIEKSLADVSVVAKESLTPQVLLGKQLFYDASSKKLSQNGYMSCASCHLDGGHDGQTWDFTSLNEGVRNTIDLRGKAGTKHGRLHWTANFDEVHDFENQIRDFGAGSGLMTDSDFELTKDPFGTPKAGRSVDLDALAAYITSLNKVPNSPYRNINGSLTENGIKGRTVFQENNCQACHSGPVFTDSPAGLRHEIGTKKGSSGTRMGGVLDGFDTPSLVGAWNSAPYLHDGSASTLKQAIVAHTSLKITGDIDQLVEYLRQIDDNETNNQTVTPVVSLTSPAENTTYMTPATISIAAEATAPQGTISKVDFYSGSSLIGTALESPYAISWKSVPAGTYTLTAKATHSNGATSISASRKIVVNSLPNQAPSVSLTAPANNATFTAPGSITITATASDSDGSIAKVEFFRGTSKLGEKTTTPYFYTWTGVAAGTYTITAKATDNRGATSTSVVRTVTVNAPPNQAPSVSLTAPANNATFTAPASIAITASASDSDGSIAKVEFFNGSTKLGEKTTSPYTYTWTSVAAGTYTITAKATDNKGATSTSTARTVKVNAPTNLCSSIASYIENGNYVAGSKVKNGNNRYECKPWPSSGWCNGAAWAYAPGTGTYWQDAWTLLGSCTSSAKYSDGNSTGENSASIQLENFPNPFFEHTEIEFQIQEAGDVSVTVYDQTGHIISTVMNGYLNAGTHRLLFDASELKAGVYILQVNSSGGIVREKMIKLE